MSILISILVVGALVLFLTAMSVVTESHPFRPLDNDDDRLFSQSSASFDSESLFEDSGINSSSSAFIDDSFHSSSSSSFDINPATGLPMIDGIGSIDVGGSPFGMDIHDSFSST